MSALILLLSLALIAFFTSAEVAYAVANRLAVETRAQHQGSLARVPAGILREPERFLTTTVVGRRLMLFIFGVAASVTLIPLLVHPATSLLGTAAAGEGAAVVLAVLLAWIVVFVCGDLLPRALIRERAVSTVLALTTPFRIFYYLLLPFSRLVAWSTDRLARMLQPGAYAFDEFMRRRDLEVIYREHADDEGLELDEEGGELLSNVLTLSTIRVKESMVPRTDIEAVEETASIAEVRDRFIRSGHSKLPVYRENIDNIVGVVFSYDLFRQPGALSEILRPIRFVPESKPAKDLLREFLETKTSIAVVIDEYGGTAGLITTEDLLEELFGDIRDEFDTEDVVLRKINETTYVLSGRAYIDELEERFGIQLPEGDYETVAGFLLEQLGTIPAPNEEHTIAGYRFVVLKASTNRVDLIKMIRVTS